MTSTSTLTLPADDLPRGSPLIHLGLQAWALAMLAFGLAIAAIPWVRGDLFSWIATGDGNLLDGVPADVGDYIAFNQSVLGAVTAGLGLAAWWLARAPLASGQRWAWTALVTTLGLWFVVDNAASLATGYPRNVAFNAVLAVPAVPLLWMARPRQRSRSA